MRVARGSVVLGASLVPHVPCMPPHRPPQMRAPDESPRRMSQHEPAQACAADVRRAVTARAVCADRRCGARRARPHHPASALAHPRLRHAMVAALLTPVQSAPSISLSSARELARTHSHSPSSPTRSSGALCMMRLIPSRRAVTAASAVRSATRKWVADARADDCHPGDAGERARGARRAR